MKIVHNKILGPCPFLLPFSDGCPFHVGEARRIWVKHGRKCESRQDSTGLKEQCFDIWESTSDNSVLHLRASADSRK